MTFFQRFIAAVSVPGMIGAAALLSVSGAVTATAGNPATDVEVELTESFYRALRAEGTKTYSTDKSEEYLRQIAVSSRYAVESNLKIIKQQERIIELLEKMNMDRQKR